MYYFIVVRYKIVLMLLSLNIIYNHLSYIKNIAMVLSVGRAGLCMYVSRWFAAQASLRTDRTKTLN